MDFHNDSDSDSDARSETMSWIDDEELEDEFYGAFYNAPIESVQVVQMLFSHDCQKCVSVSRAGYQLETPGVITPEELIPMIKCQTANGFLPFRHSLCDRARCIKPKCFCRLTVILRQSQSRRADVYRYNQVSRVSESTRAYSIIVHSLQETATKVVIT